MVLCDPQRVRFLPVVRATFLPRLIRAKGAVAGINGGFFNHQDGQLASFVRLGDHLLGDPRKNRLLMGNPALKPYLPRILDRSELRIFPSCCRIAPHSAPEDGALALLQAGPSLLPSLRLQEEAFLAPGRDPLRAYQRLPRSAVGIKPDGWVILATFDRATLPGVAHALESFGCREALALDGGSSTALSVGNQAFGTRQVHTALLVLPKI